MGFQIVTYIAGQIIETKFLRPSTVGVPGSSPTPSCRRPCVSLEEVDPLEHASSSLAFRRHSLEATRCGDPVPHLLPSLLAFPFLALRSGKQKRERREGGTQRGSRSATRSGHATAAAPTGTARLMTEGCDDATCAPPRRPSPICRSGRIRPAWNHSDERDH